MIRVERSKKTGELRVYVNGEEVKPEKGQAIMYVPQTDYRVRLENASGNGWETT